MHRDTNRQILEEINRFPSLNYGNVVGSYASGRTRVISLGTFYSEAAGRDIDLGLKEYSEYSGGEGDALNLQVACELGLIDLVEEHLPSLIGEFPLFHGVFLNANGNPVGVITEDYSRNGTVLVKTVY